MSRSTVQPERMFPGKSDPWFIAVMATVATALTAGCVVALLLAGPGVPANWLVILPVSLVVALAVLPIRSNRVELYADRLVIVYAGMRTAIPYAHVRDVRRTRNLWAGTANSLDRVFIEAPFDGDALVSVKDNDALVAELRRRCALRPVA